MSRIDELIREHCPDGVEFRRLEEIAEFQRGKSITKKDLSEGKIPVIAGGQSPAYYHSKSNRQGETITIAGSGAYAGFVSYWQQPIFVSDAFSIKPDNAVLLTKYAYHFLKNCQDYLHTQKSSGGVPHVYIKNVAPISIPLPPLPVQQEIVSILDKFTKLEAELEAELEARQKQYAYYRDALLSFNEVGRNPEKKSSFVRMNRIDELIKEHCPDGVEFKELQEIFETKNGYTPSRSNKNFWVNGTIPWFRMDDIRKNGTVLNESLQKITADAVKGSQLFPANSIIIATSATIGEHALIKVPHLSNQRFTSLSPKPEFSKKLDMRFIYYYCFVLDNWCLANTTTSSFSSVNMAGFKHFKFPLPPLPVQQEIVSILDKFDALVNDISIGLPAEIAARRKQYEHYRNRLLKFDVKSDE